MGQRFSVVIPTLLKSERLLPLLTMYCDHALVGDVIVINNATNPIAYEHRKLRVLQQARNLYVNPSWNLGVREAREELLVISNDDISFSPQVIDMVARSLRLPIGIIGPHPSTIMGPEGRFRLSPALRRTYGYGVLMFLRRSSYIPIPDDLLISSGDSWLFYNQARPNLSMRGIRIVTEMQTTSGLSEFSDTRRRDHAIYFDRYHPRRSVRLKRMMLEPFRTVGERRRRTGGRRPSPRP